MDDYAIDLVKFNLAKLKPRSIPVVLVCTGSYNPVHRSHVLMFEYARKHLEEASQLQESFQVVLGVLSPSHDAYVRQKLGTMALPSHERINMCRQAVQEAGLGELVHVSDMESKTEHFVDFPQVTAMIHKSIVEKSQLPSVRVMYLCGADHAAKCGLYQSSLARRHGVVCVARPGEFVSGIFGGGTAKMKAKIDSGNAIDGLYYVPTEVGDVSSTEIRKRVLAGDDVSDLTFNCVAERLARLWRPKQS